MTSYCIEVKQCPNCDCELGVWSINSCNTIDAKFYTDGFVDGPMYDEYSVLLMQKLSFADVINNCYCLQRNLFKEVIASFIGEFMPKMYHLNPEFQHVVNA